MISLGHQNHEGVSAEDVPRLKTQFERIMDYMADNGWHTQYEIARVLNVPQGSVGSQLRNARVDGYQVEKRRSYPKGGTWEYRLCSPPRMAAYQPELI